MTNEITQNLPKLINESYERAVAKSDKAKEVAEDAITEAQHCGRLLEQALRGRTVDEQCDWLSSNCPKIQYQTAHRWIRLSHVIISDECTSLRQAYIAAGILPEPEQGKPQVGGIPKIDGAHDWIQRACQYFNTHDLFKLPEQDRQQWKEKLRPLVELYEKL